MTDASMLTKESLLRHDVILWRHAQGYMMMMRLETVMMVRHVVPYIYTR